jgi:hypothetical protein
MQDYEADLLRERREDLRMKYRTQKRRLLAIMDAYMEKHHKTAVTMKEVSEWAFASGLWPVPARGDRDSECEEWERRLEKASAPPLKPARERKAKASDA